MNIDLEQLVEDVEKLENLEEQKREIRGEVKEQVVENNPDMMRLERKELIDKKLAEHPDYEELGKEKTGLGKKLTGHREGDRMQISSFPRTVVNLLQEYTEEEK